MLRPALSLIVAVVLATPAIAGEYVDTDNTFRFTMPDGWTQQPVAIPQLKVTVVSPRVEETGGNCNVVVTPNENLKTARQAELDEAAASIFNDDFWRSVLQAAQFENIKIEKSGARDQGGRKVFFVRATSVGKVAGNDLHVAQWQDAHLVPGALYVVTCTSLAEAISREKADFTTLMTSFEPILSTPTAALRTSSPASLTLYERPRFAGVSRVVTQDTQDLARSGWSRPAGSFSIAGGAQWQICDGVNFSGRCHTLSGDNGVGPAFVALSARRVVPRHDDPAPLAAAMSGALATSVAHKR